MIRRKPKIFYDSFQRWPANPDLDAQSCWTLGTSATGNYPFIEVGADGTPVLISPNASARRYGMIDPNVIKFPSDQWCRARLVQLGSSTSSANGLTFQLRWIYDGGSGSGYYCRFGNSNGYLGILRVNTGSATVLNSTTAAPVKIGSIIEARVTGSLIQVLVDGVVYVEATDTTHVIGNPGIGTRYSSGTKPEIIDYQAGPTERYIDANAI